MQETGLSLIVKTVTRIVAVFAFVFGLYVILYGHVSPGGGFPGGVIIACVFVLITLAFSKKVAFKFFSERLYTLCDSAGALLFLLIAFLGYTGGAFFYNFFGSFKGKPHMLFSSGSIFFSNIAIGIKVGAALFAVFIALAIFRYKEEKK